MKIRFTVSLTISRDQPASEPEPERRETDLYSNAERADRPEHQFGFQPGGDDE